MRRPAILALATLFTLGLGARSARAQGTLSTQGFGYPAGGLSTRAAATGGGFGEFDAVSTRNPASILGWARGGLYVQYDPEFRSVDAGSGTDNTTTARFPLVAAGIPVGSRNVLSVSATSLLDRSWGTVRRSGQRLGADSVMFTENMRSTGGITDIRFAGAHAFSARFAVGIGLHALGGENRLSLTRTYDDTAKFGTVQRSLRLGFQGTGLSAGAVWRPVRALAVAASAAQGGKLEMRLADTVIASAHGPSRLGAGVRFDGIEGVSLAMSWQRTDWSKLSSLGSDSLGAQTVDDVGIGADLTGPRMRNVAIMVHLGGRQRDLPFLAAGASVRERQFAGGVTLPFGGPRAQADLGIIRAMRTGGGTTKENAWILSFGISVRP
jgi:hypothetical protein